MLTGVLNQHLQNSIIKLQIIDTKFLKMTRAVISPKHFTAKESSTICKVVYEYFDFHKESPKDHFRNILTDHLNRNNAPDEEFEIYWTYLDVLDKAHTNFDYVIKQINKFVRRSVLREASIKFAELIAEDKFTEAQNLMYKALKSGIERVDDGLVYELETEVREKRLEPVEYVSDFGIPSLNKFLGGMERKTMVLVVAPEKGTKSWFLVHLGARAYSNNKTVVHLTHEISANKILERYDQLIFRLAKREDSRPKIWREMDNNRLSEKEVTSYLTVKDVPYISKKLKEKSRLLGNLFIKEYPTGTCTVGEVERYLDHLEMMYGIRADVVISDYGDIMASEDRFTDERSRIGSIYTRLRGMAVERDILLITASQAVRSTIDAANVGAQHTSEDIRKVALADLVLTIARTQDQQDLGQGTIRAAAVREGPRTSVRFGGNLDFGQFFTYEIQDEIEVRQEDEPEGTN